MIFNLVKIETLSNIKEVSYGFFRRTHEHTVAKIEDVTTTPCTLDNPVKEKQSDPFPRTRRDVECSVEPFQTNYLTPTTSISFSYFSWFHQKSLNTGTIRVKVVHEQENIFQLLPYHIYNKLKYTSGEG